MRLPLLLLQAALINIRARGLSCTGLLPDCDYFLVTRVVIIIIIIIQMSPKALTTRVLYGGKETSALVTDVLSGTDHVDRHRRNTILFQIFQTLHTHQYNTSVC